MVSNTATMTMCGQSGPEAIRLMIGGVLRFAPLGLAFFVLATIGGNLGCAEDGILAFPGAEGAGKYTVGGRGGTVYRVTNLNASGPGSLADAVSQPNRIVVFAVSGVIDLSEGKKGKGGKIAIDQPHITIAGQTAPGEGICLKGGALVVSASDVIVRYLRSRRGWVRVGDMGDAFTAKPAKSGVQTKPVNESQESFDKRKKKKLGRGKDVYEHGSIENIIFDHLSASWATDENLSVTHPNNTTVQYCIASEGLDYANPKQTPPNHSEGSLWGVNVAGGRATMHHTLYAHNRLRNPRLVSGEPPSAVLDFRNNVVYDASEYFSHSGHGAVCANWINNYYKHGPSTPEKLRGEMFRFEHNPNSRMFADGNFIFAFPQATRDNWLAVRYEKTLTHDNEKTMRVQKPFDAVATNTQSAAEAYEVVLAEAGATLPARDAVDLRIVNEVRNGTGHVIEKETDLPPDQRWPQYVALPAPTDSDADGIPDYWEEQFGLDKNNPADSMAVSAGGYANIEHYFNNTDPKGGSTPIVFIAASVSRALPQNARAGELRVTRTGSTAAPLVVYYTVGGTAEAGADFEKLPGSVTIPAGQSAAAISIVPRHDARKGKNKTVFVTLTAGMKGYHVGCPSAALVVIQD
jgi:hypothetical protein